MKENKHIVVCQHGQEAFCQYYPIPNLWLIKQEDFYCNFRKIVL